MRYQSIAALLRVALPVCLLAGVLACEGCNPWDPPVAPPGPPPPQYDRSSRDNLMAFFAKAHEDREIEEYKECLHPLYSFWFWEEPGPQGPWPRPWINRTEDIGVTQNMFSAEEVADIRVDFTNYTTEGDSGSWWVDLQIVEGQEREVYWSTFMVNMHVEVHTPDEDVDHWVNGRADIYVLPDPEYEDLGLWTIWKITDRTAEHKRKGTLTTSWASLKRLSRPPPEDELELDDRDRPAPLAQ